MDVGNTPPVPHCAPMSRLSIEQVRNLFGEGPLAATEFVGRMTSMFGNAARAGRRSLTELSLGDAEEAFKQAHDVRYESRPLLEKSVYPGAEPTEE